MRLLISLALAALLSMSVPARAQDVQRAQQLFQQGIAAYDAGRLDEAARLLREADAIVHSPELTFNIARVYERMGESREAIRHFERYLREARPDRKVLALTVHEDAGYMRLLLEAGAAGYVLKRAVASELVQAIRAVAGGGTYLDPTLAGNVVGGFVRPLAGVPSFFVDASVRRTASSVGGFTQGRLGASVQAAQLRLAPYLRTERTTIEGGPRETRSFVGVNAFLLPRMWEGSFWSQVWARGDAEFEEGAGVRTAAAVVGRELTPGIRLEVGIPATRRR